MTVIGIDYSITSPAISVYSGKPNPTFESCQHYSLTTHENISRGKLKNINFSFHKPYKTQTERFHNIASWAMEIIDSFIYKGDIDIIGIEGYAMGAKGQVFNIAENTGALKLRLFDKGLNVETVAPTSVKKFFTGKGNGKKEMMYEQFIKDTGIDLKKILQPSRLLGSPTTDIIDSFAITKYFWNELHSE
jgi:Holliday junction resolvasome RuvABC endonuclease subunit